MKIVCEECGSKYSVDDSKVQNKSFKITCKKCGNKIIIDNTKKIDDEITTNDPFDSQTNWDDDMPAGMGADMEFDDQATKIMSYEDAMKMENQNNSPSPTGAEMDFDDEATQIMSSSQAASLNATAAKDMGAAEEDWYVHINGQQVGPLTLSQLQSKIKQEKLPETTNVWKTGMADWSMIKDIAQLSSFIVKSAPADPFGGLDSNVAAFGNDSLLDDSDAESLFNDKQAQPNAASFSGSSQSDPFAGNFGGGGLDLKSLIDQEDLEEDEEDASSKSKVIDFRDIQGNNNKKIVVQHASFNASTGNSGGGNKGLIIALIAIIVLALGGIGTFFILKGKGGEEQKIKLTKIFLTSAPSDALIKLNGELKGKTGGELISVKPGKYQVQIIKDGYKTFEDIIIVKKEDFIKKYTLVAKPIKITIKTGITDADITVGTQKLKTDPNGEVTLELKPASDISVKVEKDGALKISKTVNLTVDGNHEFDLSSEVVTAANAGTTEVASAKTTQTTRTNKKTHSRKTNKRTTKKYTKKVTVKKVQKDDLDDILGDTKPKPKRVASNLPKTLTQKQVLSVIKRIYPKVKTCGKNAGVSGKVKVKFRINGSGSVSNIKVAPNGGAAKNCIHSKVRSMRFPKFSGSPIPVTFPFKM